MTTDTVATTAVETTQDAPAQEPSNPVAEVNETETPEQSEKPPEKTPDQIAFEKRIARQTAANRETNRQLQEARNRIAELEKATAKADPLADKPHIDNFDTPEEYAEALADWKLDQKTNAPKEPSVEDKVQQELKRKEFETTFQQKEADFRKSAPDYDKSTEVVNGLLKYVDPNHPSTQAFSTTLLNAPNPPALVHYLGQNPREAIALMSMDPFEIQDRLGVIIDQLAETAPVQAGKTETLAPNLPTPPSALKTGSTKVNKSVEEMSGRELLNRYAKGK